MTIVKNILVAAAIVGGALAIAAPASAYIACNHDGDCWHTHSRVKVPGVTFEYHPDSWYFGQHWDADPNRHFRDYHEGRGYYRGGVWVTL